jgi:hypothetical protein
MQQRTCGCRTTRHRDLRLSAYSAICNRMDMSPVATLCPIVKTAATAVRTQHITAQHAAY